ncbi:unnamed protein product [Acanthoscelides obtectus]|uniref:Uncharacterized protein n=1 Tax=Acanthoscelides obtectus TaxID=200917 RepID=A0A9P0PNC4_ACAOB|nr:unnamed protein product [Acanthoscelides obtectus]CAK1639393.1 Fatty acid synthase [Acanthoscelides obtectus]
MEVDTKSSDARSEERRINLEMGRVLCASPPEEQIVISGLSGAFPMSKNVYEFRDNLFQKVNMVLPNRRWTFNHPEIPDCSGTLPEINRYDAGFFGTHERQGHSFDTMGRMIQEKAIEAIMDAGINPTDMEGSKTGVYVGVCFSESEKCWFWENKASDNFAWTGASRSMIAHRLSQYLKLRGPSITVDTACSSSLFALENAFKAIRSGEIDTALVGGVNICCHPFVSLQFSRLGVLSKDGSCKAFDKAGNGYARSECVGVVVLQKAKDANRVYGDVIYAKTSCDGYKEQGITYPSGKAQMHLLSEFYEDCDVKQADLSFLEAHGTGTFVGDPEECGAMDAVLAKNRSIPLLIGSVKSNIGHSEPGSGLCSITKCIIGMETGLIPPNLHYSEPRPEIKALCEGRMSVVTEKMPFDEEKGLFGINSFGFGGGNCHILLRTNKKKKINKGLPSDNLPRLVFVSGRTAEAVQTLLNELKDNQLDAEHVALLHNIFRKNIRNHIYRGYNVVSKSGETCRYYDRFHGKGTPLFVTFGELTDWITIGRKLLEIPVFADSFQRTQKYLLENRINIIDIMKKPANRDSYSVLGNIAVQLGIVDVLRQLEVKPEKYFGYSYGELLAAHLDGKLSLKDMLNCAVSINEAFSKVCVFTNGTSNGHSNGVNGSTKGLSNGYNGHSDNNNGDGYIVEQLRKSFKSNQQTPIKEKLLKELRSILPATKGQVFTPEYFLSALTNNVHSTTSAIQENSLLLNLGWVSPTKYDEVTVINYGTDDKQDPTQELLKTIGSLYVHGHQPQVQHLYPSVQFPVSRGTRMISPYVRWNHKREWFVPEYNLEAQTQAQDGQRSVMIQLSDQQWSFIDGHVIDGRNLFPATGYLFLAWETLSIIKELPMSVMTVVFEDCRFHRATSMPPKGHVVMYVTVQTGTGEFEVVEGDVPVVTGRIKLLDEYVKKRQDVEFSLPPGGLKTKDIYKELRLRGYNYTKGFRAMQDCDVDATRAHIKWDDNWVTFLDNMLQMKILQTDTRLLYVPTYIREMVIPGKVHLEWVNRDYINVEKTPNLPVFCDKDTDIIRCGDVAIKGLLASSIPRRKDLGVPVLEKYEFVPNITSTLDLQQSVRVNLQIILENTLMFKIKAVEVIDVHTEKDTGLVTPIAHTVLEDQPLIAPIMKILSKTPIEEGANGPIPVEDKNVTTEKDCLLVVASKLFTRSQPEDMNTILVSVAENGYVMSREPANFDLSTISNPGIVICTFHRTPTESLVFFKKQPKEKPMNIVQITDTDTFPWVEKLQKLIKLKPYEDIVLYAEKEPLSGIMGLVNCLRREPESRNVKGLFLMDTDKTFDSNDPFFINQLSKDMAVNILKEGKWGTYRHLLLANTEETENEHFFVNVTLRGDLSSLKWLEGPLDHTKKAPAEKVMAYVCYATLNFRDVMTATGKINADVVTQDRIEQECVQGFEFSGIDESGNRVMAMSTSGALTTMFFNDAYLNLKIPDNMTLEEAATIPVVYSTIIFALILRAKMKRGDTLLIHSGTGGIGQAAIRIALYEGCTVYTTVGTQEKREFLKKEFPQLNDNNIGNSRDTTFEQMIYRETKGRGVDIVLNSLAEDKLLAGVRCLAHGGRFVEIGKFDLASNHALQLEFLKKEASFIGVMLDKIFSASPENKKEIVDYLYKAMASNAVKPLNRTVFKYNEIEQAFRYMATGKHMGKVMIQVRDPKEITALPPVKTFKGFPRYFCYPEKTYIIIGGLGGFGLELADWLILRGARRVVLTSRKGVQTGYQRLRIKTWRSYGALVHISKADITTREGCEKLIKESSQFGSVHAVFNLAVVLADALFENQSPDTFLTSFKPKAKATEYLDEVTREMCPDLRDFVIFSSVTCGRGNAGQTNYGMANSVMERICERRRKDGYPALAIEWGAIGQVGLVAEMQEEHFEIEISGTLQQKISSCLNALNLFLRQKEAAIVSSIVVAEKRGGIGAIDNAVDAVLYILGKLNLD